MKSGTLETAQQSESIPLVTFLVHATQEQRDNFFRYCRKSLAEDGVKGDPDIEKYDRGYYFRFDELPFPLARNESELLAAISNFNPEDYKKELNTFLDTKIGMFENGTSSKSLCEWMKAHSIVNR